MLWVQKWMDCFRKLGERLRSETGDEADWLRMLANLSCPCLQSHQYLPAKRRCAPATRGRSKVCLLTYLFTLPECQEYLLNQDKRLCGTEAGSARSTRDCSGTIKKPPLE